MTTPYILPSMLKQLAPLGIDWDSIPIAGASAQANTAALLDICYIASDAIDTEVFQPLRCTLDVEELTGPDQRLYIERSTGIARAQMQHWPVTAAVGGRLSPAASFPPQWQNLPSGSLIVSQASAQFLGGSFLGSSGSDGMNEIDIQPGYVTWWNRRNGWRLQLAYENGWPTAGLMPSTQTTGDTQEDSSVIANIGSDEGLAVGAPVVCLDVIPDDTTIVAFDASTITLSNGCLATTTGSLIQVGYAPGVTTLNVDDVTGMLGTSPTVFDGAQTESVRVIAAVANDPVTVLPGVSAQIGEGVITLSAPTRLAHVGSRPAQSLVSSLPSNVRLAGYYYAGAEALQRGGTAFTVQALPGSLQTSGGTPSIGDMTEQAQNQLKNFKRVF